MPKVKPSEQAEVVQARKKYEDELIDKKAEIKAVEKEINKREETLKEIALAVTKIPPPLTISISDLIAKAVSQISDLENDEKILKSAIQTHQKQHANKKIELLKKEKEFESLLVVSYGVGVGIIGVVAGGAVGYVVSATAVGAVCGGGAGLIAGVVIGTYKYKGHERERLKVEKKVKNLAKLIDEEKKKAHDMEVAIIEKKGQELTIKDDKFTLQAWIKKIKDYDTQQSGSTTELEKLKGQLKDIQNKKDDLFNEDDQNENGVSFHT